MALAPCRNPKPLIQLQPKVLVDQKNRKAFATGGDILLANGEKIPLPGGFALPTTGLWSGLLDIPEVSLLSLEPLFIFSPASSAEHELVGGALLVWQCYVRPHIHHLPILLHFAAATRMQCRLA